MASPNFLASFGSDYDQVHEALSIVTNDGVNEQRWRAVLGNELFNAIDTWLVEQGIYEEED